MNMLTTPHAYAYALADREISRRFGYVFGLHALDAYWDFVTRRATVHLAEGNAHRIDRTAGEQRRSARLFIENATDVMAAVPMNDPATGQDVEAIVPLGAWINVIEMGADGAWVYDRTNGHEKRGYVRTELPLASHLTSARASVARLITNAQRKQQTRFIDGDSLNLRWSNLTLLGDPLDNPMGAAKVNHVDLVRHQASMRQQLAGAGFGFAEEVE